MLFCCFLQSHVKEARKCIFAVHESSACCADTCRASKPVAIVTHSCGKTLSRNSCVQPSVSTAKLLKRVLQEPVAFKGCSFASSCWDTTRYDRCARYAFCPDKRLFGFLHIHRHTIFMEEQILQECLHCPDAACCVVCSTFAEVEPLLEGHPREESRTVV